jgi:hypothetical protein
MISTNFIIRNKYYLQGILELARTNYIESLWIPYYLLEEKNLIDTLYLWEPDLAEQWFTWINTNEFENTLKQLYETGKLRRFETPSAKTIFRSLLSEIEEINEAGAIMCAEILSFSFEAETMILQPILGLTDVVKKSGNSLIRRFNHCIDKKQEFLSSILGHEKLHNTRSLRWLLGGALTLVSLVRNFPAGEAIGIALWVLDP